MLHDLWNIGLSYELPIVGKLDHGSMVEVAIAHCTYVVLYGSVEYLIAIRSTRLAFLVVALLNSGAQTGPSSSSS